MPCLGQLAQSSGHAVQAVGGQRDGLQYTTGKATRQAVHGACRCRRINHQAWLPICGAGASAAMQHLLLHLSAIPVHGNRQLAEVMVLPKRGGTNPGERGCLVHACARGAALFYNAASDAGKWASRAEPLFGGQIKDHSVCPVICALLPCLRIPSPQKCVPCHLCPVALPARPIPPKVCALLSVPCMLRGDTLLRLPKVRAKAHTCALTALVQNK